MAAIPDEAATKVGDANVEELKRTAAWARAAREPGKNIVLCSDGTGNRGGKARGTNVWAMVNAVWRSRDSRGKLPPKPQVVFYDDGVGTSKFFLFKLLGGAFGFGHSRNIRQLYKSLVTAYQPDDSIYLFGFSRGAYTVRGLAGMINNCGILDWREFNSSADLDEAISVVFRVNQARYWQNADRKDSALRRGDRKANGDRKAIREYETEYEGYKQKKLHKPRNGGEEYGQQIRFIGVWDTVDAIGLPIDALADGLDFFARYRFRDHNLDPNKVTKACHAISIDDERKTFWPVLWNETKGSHIDQVWFSGVHSNVGGGYPKDQVAQVALDWMMEKAAANELWLYKDVLEKVREEANPHGKIYDSRAGLAAYYRYRPRNFAKICGTGKDSKIKTATLMILLRIFPWLKRPEVKTGTPKVHVSVLRRIARGTDDYAPGTIPDEIEVVGTRKQDEALAQSLQQVFNLEVAKETRVKNMQEVNRNVGKRRWLYGWFLVFTLAIVALAAWFRWFAEASVIPDPEKLSNVSTFVMAGIRFLLPDVLVNFFKPLFLYVGLNWGLALVPVAALITLVGLKKRYEQESELLARDAWTDFRKKAEKEQILDHRKAGPS